MHSLQFLFNYCLTIYRTNFVSFYVLFNYCSFSFSLGDVFLFCLYLENGKQFSREIFVITRKRKSNVVWKNTKKSPVNFLRNIYMYDQ